MVPIVLLLLSLIAVRTIAAMEVLNLARTGTAVYAAAGSDGVLVVDPKTGEIRSTIPPPGAFSGVHDLSFADGLLFVLDTTDGLVGVFDVSEEPPTFREGSEQDVNVTPFSGVSAGGGRMVVSGGTGQMSVFSYTEAGETNLLTNEISLGIGQPDVLVNSEGTYAYVSTDFSGAVDDSGFGITTVDLGSDDISNPSLQRVGIPGAGFTLSIKSPASFPLRSVISGSRLLVAHSEGLSILSLSDPAQPTVTTTVSLDFEAVNVDADDDIAIVVGGNNDPPSAARVDLQTNEVRTIELPDTESNVPATGVSLSENGIIVAAGELLFCDEECAKTALQGGTTSTPESSSDSDANEGEDGENEEDKDVCVEEEYLLTRGIPRSALLHVGSTANVLCPVNGLPCGTASHVVRFAGKYMTYKEMCAIEACHPDRKVVNGVSMVHARALCQVDDVHCVVPHVMRTGFQVERSLIAALHNGIVRW